jgi:hypothetical protein
LAICRTKESAGRTRAKGAANWNPGAARFAVNQLLAPLVRLLPAALACVHLSELTNGVEKVSDDLEVGTQPPVKEQKQQRYQADNK